MTIRFGPLPPTIVTFSENHPGHPGVAMVAVFLSDEQAKELATDGGTPEGNIHTTVLYLGDTSDIGWAKDLVPQLVASVATEVGPISGVLSRLSHFGPNDGKMAVVLELDSPEIHDLHSKVQEAFKEAKVPWSLKFPVYRPHVTLGYWPENQIPKEFADPGPLDVPIPVTFSQLSVVWDEKRTDSTLSKKDLAAAQPLEFECRSRACAPPPVGTGGSRPGPGSWSHAQTTISIPQFVHNAASAYRKQHELPEPEHNSGKVMADENTSKELAKAYDALPDDDPKAHAAYKQLVKEVKQQFNFMTKELGIKVEVIEKDPYTSHSSLVRDVTKNKRLKVLSTASTGRHPLFTDEENDMFRAVHDFFGHVGTGRAFDRHGEEAAWVEHASMFSVLARGAVTTETRGQNATLINVGHFPAQKVGLLPEKFYSDAAIRGAKRVSSKVELDWRAQPRDGEGRWTRIGGYFTAIKSGGISVDLRNSSKPSRGFALSRTRGIFIHEDEAFDGNDLNANSIVLIDQFVMLRRRELFSTSARHLVVLGVHHDTKNGTVDVDVTDILPERTAPAKVVALGLKRNQKSAWNLHDGVLIEIGGTGSVRALKADAGNVAEELSGPSGERAEGALGGPVSPGEAQEERLRLSQPLELTESFSTIQPLEFHGVNTHNEGSHGRRGPNKPNLKSDLIKSRRLRKPQIGNQADATKLVTEKAKAKFADDHTNEAGDLLIPEFENLSDKQQAKYETTLRETLGLSDADIQQMHTNLDEAADKSTDAQGDWYRDENKWGTGVAKRTGVEPGVVFGITSLLSGQRKWSGNNSANKEVTERLLDRLVADRPLEIMDAIAEDYNRYYNDPSRKAHTRAGYTELSPGTYKPSELTSHQLASINPFKINNQTGSPPVHHAIMLARGEITLNQAITGPKQRSFVTNLTFPERPRVSTNDVWHYRVIAGGIKFLLRDNSKNADGTFANPDPDNPKKGKQVRLTLKEFEGLITGVDKKTGKPVRGNSPQSLFQTGLANKKEKLDGLGYYPWITKITNEAAERFSKKTGRTIISSDFQARVWKVGGGDPASGGVG